MAIGSLGRVVYAARAGKAIAAQPYEGMQRTLERVAERRDWRRPPWGYQATEDHEQQFQKILGATSPSDVLHEFQNVWDCALADLATQDLAIGRGAFGGWDDGDPRLGQLVWSLARHLRPRTVVETGVARGLTTRVLLEALVGNGFGRLWSIDLPPLLDRGLIDETGAAVPERLHDRWTLLRGSSRRLLPGLVAELGQIDLFVHDSLHTARNVRFELAQVWPALAPGGVAVIDDVDQNAATGQFLRAHPNVPAVFTPAEDGKALIACLVKPRQRTKPGSKGNRRPFRAL
jgi:predicted O-methyltransferase YrrM